MNSNHVNIIHVVDFGIHEKNSVERPFYVMPFYETTLRNLITEGVETNEILPLFAKMLHGVEAAHRREICHRDLKPENILLNPSNNDLVIADFGIARFKREELLTLVETRGDKRLANFQYAAPEQKIRGASVDTRADIFALGLILNELFTKRVAVGSGYAKIEKVAPRYSFLDELVDLMIRQEPTERPESIEEVKLQMRAREYDYFKLQRIDELRNQVIPLVELGDEQTSEPITLSKIEFENNYFIYILSRNPENEWSRIFNSIDDRHNALLGAWPSNMRIADNRIFLSCHENRLDQSGQLLADKVKQYIREANRRYAENLRTRRTNEENNLVNAQKAKELQKQKDIAEEQRAREILSGIKI